MGAEFAEAALRQAGGDGYLLVEDVLGAEPVVVGVRRSSRRTWRPVRRSWRRCMPFVGAVVVVAGAALLV
jgi:hypothetical protein